jgi:hypothetical protein
MAAGLADIKIADKDSDCNKYTLITLPEYSGVILTDLHDQPAKFQATCKIPNLEFQPATYVLYLPHTGSTPL